MSHHSGLQNGTLIYNDKDIAERFNNYFSNIGFGLSEKIGEMNDSFERFVTPSSGKFQFHRIRLLELLGVIDKTKASKVSATDNISSRLLKDSKEIM